MVLDIIRVFDALNDIKKYKDVYIEATKKWWVWTCTGCYFIYY